MSRLRNAVDQTSDHPSGKQAHAAQSSTAGAGKAAFVHRLQVILAHWPSADRLARSMGVSPSAFRKWLKGEAEPSRERLIALARAAGVGVAWLAEGEGPEPSFGHNGDGRRKRLPDPGEATDWNQFAILPEMGPMPVRETSIAIQAPGSHLALRRDWIRDACGVDPEHLVLEVATDESMAPTIRRSDTVLLDTTTRRIDGDGIYVLDIGSQRQIRRVQRRHDGSLILISDNQAYHPDVVDNESTSAIVILGRVVWVGGTVS